MREALGGRVVAIAVVAVVSGASFALGFFVGKASVRGVAQTAPALQEVASPVEISPTEAPAQKAPEGVEKGAAAGEAGTFTVQAGSFLDSAHAEEFKNRLQEKGYGAYVMRTVDSGNRTVYKVRVGSFRDRRDAELLALKLKKVSGADAFVAVE
ncbi:MAG: hypothetical protein Kow0025_21680 [Thermodesulfovibrionales bacterium]